MSLSGLIDTLSSLEALETLSPQRGSHRVCGLLAAARPAVIAAMRRRRTGPLLAVTAHPQAAHELAEELRNYGVSNPLVFPAIESLPYERVHVDRAVLADREAISASLSRDSKDTVVASIRALMQPVQTPTTAEAIGPLTQGLSMTIENLIGALVRAGYAETTTVIDPGTFARRGGVVDVFPAGVSHPIRIDFLGNEIDSVRSFDPVTQRSLAPASGVLVMPLASLDEDRRVTAYLELMDKDITSMNAEARTRWQDDLARLESGATFDDVAVFAPYLLSQPCSLLACLPLSGTVIVEDASAVHQLMSDLCDQSRSIQIGLEESGDLPVGLKPPLLAIEHIEQSLRDKPYVELVLGSAERPGDLDWSGLFAPVNLYAGRVRVFARDVAARSNAVNVIASMQGERVVELLSEEDVAATLLPSLPQAPGAGITVVASPATEGWQLAGGALSLYTDHELFGRARVRAVQRKPRPAREAFFTGYAPGDYVVHIEHGIGRFDAMTRMTIDGAEREYGLVQYAGSDRVYVPTDQLERLTRYVGVGDTPPPLNKLGGGEWQRARTRAQEAAAEIARELIDLYAKRMARPGHAFDPDTPWQGELESSFPYIETEDQLQAVQEVKRDMEEPRPMDRLVCADVGYGKTEVAVRAAFKAVMDGRQVAVLVPTTILAQQHFETFIERFGAFPVRVEALSRFRSPAEQKQILRRVAAGEVDVLIGTHRLLQKDVAFNKLGLLIIDEEQRFGVRHKEQLKKLRESIDVLTLTATPIPRTLHMGLVGIREISVIETAPEGRVAIKTSLQPYDDRTVREAILRELDRDGQVYFVHNRVATIDAVAERIRRSVPEARVVVGHGQMDESQLEKVMLAFAHHQADVLICSTIIENGLDIPDANTIVIDNAHRLGLTQLYQLRGRVGRSQNQAYAYLLYPRDVRLTHEAGQRMEAVFEAQELGAGFSIAMRDLEIRGAGNLLGAQQSGHATAIGFDLYTRMISDAVEQLQGVSVEEQPLVSIDLPLTMYLPKEYVNDEAERLTLYRRLASTGEMSELVAIADEIRDRFGQLPVPAQNLLDSVRIKALAIGAGVESVSLGRDFLVLRTRPTGVYDRVSLYREYGMDAKVSTNVLRIPRRRFGEDWKDKIETILEDMEALRSKLRRPEQVGA